MPANLPPEFHKISQDIKKAKTPAEKISLLEKLLAITPKHKGTEKVQAEIKSKIAKLKRKKPKTAKSEISYSIPKQGAGQVVLVGRANSGKSSLLNVLTNTKTKIGSYPFTTQELKPAMMPYQNILIQLIDTPPLTEDSPSLLKNILDNSDALIAVFDLSKNPVKDIKRIKRILKDWNLFHKKVIFVGNKIDLKKSKKNLKKIKSEIKQKIYPVSCSKKSNIKKIKEKIFKTLEIIRVYTKSSNNPPDFEHPFIIKKNSKLIELARKIHHDFKSSFKYAKLFTSSSEHPKIIGKDYILKDKDIVEIHI